MSSAEICEVLHFGGVIKKLRSGAVIIQINRDKTGYDVDGISYYFKSDVLQRFTLYYGARK